MFYPETAVLPTVYKTDELLLRPLTSAHGQLDYRAVMRSKKMLRVWSGHEWPSDDFTLADNLQDLEKHALEHQERIAFTYTVLNPSGRDCLGCVYINPLTDLQKEAPDFHAIVRFWVLEPRLADGLEQRCLTTLTDWFNTNSWAFDRLLLHTRVADQRQVALFRDAGFREVMTHHYEGRGGAHLFFELLPTAP